MYLLSIKKWWRQLSISRRLIIALTSSFILLIVLFSVIFDMVISHSVWNVAEIYATHEMKSLLFIVNHSKNLEADLTKELSWRDGEYIFYYGEVIENGKVLASTRHIQSIFNNTTFPINTDIENLDDLNFKIISIKKNDYMVASVIPKNKPEILIKLAFNITFVKKILSLIYHTSLWLLVVFLIFAVWIERRLIKTSLQQLSTIVQHFQKITTKNLTLQLDEDQFPVELRELVVRSKNILNEIDQELQRLVSFSSELSHELRTPLQIMMGQTEVALSSPYSEEKITQILQMNLQELQGMQALIENMILLSRLDTGKSFLNYEHFNALDEINVILASYQQRFKEQDLSCNIKGDVEIKADRIMFKRIIINLLDNAIKYSKPHRSISIEMTEQSSYAVIKICDEGIGIDQDSIEKIFNRFYSGKDYLHPAKVGLGIGLNIVGQLMNLHHGRVEVSSTIDEGSCFTLFFPQ